MSIIFSIILIQIVFIIRLLQLKFMLLKTMNKLFNIYLGPFFRTGVVYVVSIVLRFINMNDVT